MVSVVASAEPPPQLSPFDDHSWKATLKAQPTHGANMGTYPIKFEATTLNDVQKAAAVGEIAHQGDAGDSIYWLCYTNKNQNQDERIWIISHGEMGGPEHSVTLISAQILPNAKATPDCPTLPANLKPVSLDNHLWLNSPASDLLKPLGTPSYQKGSWQSYSYQGKVPGDCDGGGFDLTNWLMLRLDKGRVTALHAGQVTSC